MSMRGMAATTAMVLLAGCGSVASESVSAGRCDGSPAANRRVVEAFYTEGLVGLRPRPAFERYMTADFVEHKPDVPGGTREAAAKFLEELIAEVPQPRWQVRRMIAEGLPSRQLHPGRGGAGLCDCRHLPAEGLQDRRALGCRRRAAQGAGEPPSAVLMSARTFPTAP
jgi:hypothetical protein